MVGGGFVCLYRGVEFTWIGVIERKNDLGECCLVARGGVEVARRLRAIFADRRVIGEWFDLSEKDVDWIVWVLGFKSADRVN